MENLSDQLEGYSEEIRNLVIKFRKEGFSKEEAMEIIRLGEMAQFVDIFHHLDKDFKELIGVLQEYGL